MHHDIPQQAHRPQQHRKQRVGQVGRARRETSAVVRQDFDPPGQLDRGLTVVAAGGEDGGQPFLREGEAGLLDNALGRGDERQRGTWQRKG